jgi:hypothetical protein
MWVIRVILATPSTSRKTNGWEWPLFMVGYLFESAYRFFAPARSPAHLFLMSGVRMHRWSALVEIVRSFNERGSPKLAFATFALFLLVPFAALVLTLALGLPSLPLVP